jgi:diguanylate cyclase (GGDEF)-like protein/PAS domain S-box-containing protein
MMLLKASLESPVDMIILAIDKQYNYYYFNKAHQEAMKYAYGKDVKPGMNLLDCITSESDKEKAKHNYDLAMTGVSHSTIQEYGDISVSYYETFYNPIFDENHEIIGATAFARNITERIEAQKKLRESEENFRLIYSSMSQGLALHEIITDEEDNPIDYRFISMNESFEHLSGLKAAETIGRKVSEVLPQIESFWIERYGKVALTGKPDRFENYSKELGRFFSVTAYSPKPRQFAVLIDDITDRKNKEEKILYINNHDYLTDLFNRRFFVETFETIRNPSHLPLGIMMLDVNGLKIINDAYGHDMGDLALKTVAQVLKETFEPHDIVARIGGDEFAILLPNTSVETMQKHSDFLKTKLEKKAIRNVVFSLAIGFDIISDCSKTLDDILKSAENMMYRNKLSEGISIRNQAIKAILNTLTEKYDPERIHSERVSAYCQKFGETLGLPSDDIKQLSLAGLFHDIGKISIPDAVLEKPEKLTPEEYEIIKTHTQIGYQILRAADQYSDLAIHARSHHERWDGKGYPQGLKRDEIPFFSRIIGIVDAFEAMTSERPYKKPLSIEKAVEELKRCSGSQFDPTLVPIFVNNVIKLQ